jgi:hypothetical protein
MRTRYKAGDVIGCYELVSKAGKGSYWVVRCTVCGATHEKLPAQLKQNVRKGCKACTKGTTTHGKSQKDPTYISWSRMWQRVRGTDPNALITYAHVTVDPTWESFEKFYEDMGDRPEGTSLDRIDSFKGYCKDNCRWVDRTTQNRNKTDTLFLTFDGETKALADWADEWGLAVRLVRERLTRQKYTTKEDLSKPAAKRRKRDAK